MPPFLHKRTKKLKLFPSSRKIKIEQALTSAGMGWGGGRQNGVCGARNEDQISSDQGRRRSPRPRNDQREPKVNARILLEGIFLKRKPPTNPHHLRAVTKKKKGSQKPEAEGKDKTKKQTRQRQDSTRLDETIRSFNPIQFHPHSLNNFRPREIQNGLILPYSLTVLSFLPCPPPPPIEQPTLRGPACAADQATPAQQPFPCHSPLGKIKT